MDPFLRRRVGKTSLEVTQLGMGGASLGDMRESIPEAQATATIEAAHAAGIGYFDTSPWYGNGKSELRFGHVLRTKPRDSFVLSTKVGRVHTRPADPDTYTHPGWAGGLPFEPRFDYTRDGVLKSYEMSLARLGPQPRRGAADPRPRSSPPEVGGGRRGGPRPARHRRRLAGARRSQGARRDRGHRRRRQSRRHDPALPGALADRFLPRGHALHAARAGGARGAGDVRRARRLDRDRRALRLRHPGAGAASPAHSTTTGRPSRRSSPRRSASPPFAGATTCRSPRPPCSFRSGTEASSR